jgi:hypothetical protein
MVGSAAFLEFVDEGNETAVNLHQKLLGEYGRPNALAKRLPVLKELFAPIMLALTQVEADKASLSRLRALVRQLEAHAVLFTAARGDEFCSGVVNKREQPDMPTTVIDSRLRVFFYKPAMTAAYLLDPINFRLRVEL